MTEKRKVTLRLVVELYDEQRREEQDGIRMFVLSRAETHRIPIYYCCFDTVDSIWDHIGWRLCAGRSTATAAHIQSHASDLCGSIQEAVRIRGRHIPDGEPIQLSFTVQLSQVSPGQDAGEGLGSSEPTRTVPASKSSVQSLKRKRAAMDENGDDSLAKKVCIICQDEFGKEGSLAAMPCDHEFHEKCIVGWLERAHSCPLCRFRLPTD
ncbi:E3 ubiquitin-protein ligase RING1-like [Nymphaea colorata]|nr:E3 ubiquitin-protein ligase RING1-like [Nymphaea colorata]